MFSYLGLGALFVACLFHLEVGLSIVIFYYFWGFYCWSGEVLFLVLFFGGFVMLVRIFYIKDYIEIFVE